MLMHAPLPIIVNRFQWRRITRSSASPMVRLDQALTKSLELLPAPCWATDSSASGMMPDMKSSLKDRRCPRLRVRPAMMVTESGYRRVWISRLDVLGAVMQKWRIGCFGTTECPATYGLSWRLRGFCSCRGAAALQDGITPFVYGPGCNNMSRHASTKTRLSSPWPWSSRSAATRGDQPQGMVFTRLTVEGRQRARARSDSM
jgi:hypothetical protein